MKEYEIVARYYNACAGAARPQTHFEVVELGNPDDFVRAKHGRDFDRFSKELLPTGQLLYEFSNGGIRYTYEFTEV